MSNYKCVDCSTENSPFFFSNPIEENGYLKCPRCYSNEVELI